MKKKIFAFIAVAVLAFMFSFSACRRPWQWPWQRQNEYVVAGSLIVSVKTEYKNAFLENEITIEDFNCEYIESIHYIAWYSTDIGGIQVQLKKEYENKIDEAIQSIGSLDFVFSVEKEKYKID